MGIFLISNTDLLIIVMCNAPMNTEGTPGHPPWVVGTKGWLLLREDMGV